MFNSLQPHGLQQARLPCPSLSPKVGSNSCPLCRWCHQTVSSSVHPFSSCPQSFSASVLPMNIQGWFPLGWLVWSPCHPRDSQECSPAPQFKSISSLALRLLYGQLCLLVHDYWKNHSFDYTDLCWQSDISTFNMLSRFVIAFLPRSNCLLVSWLPSPSIMILEPRKIKSLTVSIFVPSICHEVMGLNAMILVW